MRKMVLVLVLVLPSCTWLRETGEAFCAGPANTVQNGLAAVRSVGGEIPVAGPAIEMGAWGIHLLVDAVCFVVEQTAAAPERLSEEVLSLVGLGTEEAASVEQ